MNFVSTNSNLDKFSLKEWRTYSPNKVDILLILSKCNKNYKRDSRHYAELYPNRPSSASDK